MATKQGGGGMCSWQQSRVVGECVHGNKAGFKIGECVHGNKVGWWGNVFMATKQGGGGMCSWQQSRVVGECVHGNKAGWWGNVFMATKQGLRLGKSIHVAIGTCSLCSGTISFLSVGIPMLLCAALYRTWYCHIWKEHSLQGGVLGKNFRGGKPMFQEIGGGGIGWN